jgi:mercuric ion binding protein
MYKLLASFTLGSLIAAPVWAGPQTVTLAVSKMTCAACPITVRKALSRVPGVTAVSVSLEKKQATVVFDDAQTTVAALTRATTDAGYPSTAVMGAAK